MEHSSWVEMPRIHAKSQMWIRPTGSGCQMLTESLRSVTQSRNVILKSLSHSNYDDITMSDGDDIRIDGELSQRVTMTVAATTVAMSLSYHK